MSTDSQKRKERKAKTIVSMYNELGNYKQIIIIQLDNIDANQVNEIRKYLRRNKLGTIVIGKNTVIRKSLQMRVKGMSEEDKKSFPQLKEQRLPKVASLLDVLKNKIAFIFTDANVMDFKRAITKVPIPREAKVGSIAPCDVIIPEGPTGLPPAEVNFFHALGIQVRINKGILDLQKAVNLVKKGDKVGNSEAGLLKKLNMQPFTYPLIFDKIYEDGNIYPASVFEVSNEDLLARIQGHVKNVAALSMEVNYVTSLTAPLLVANTFKQMLALAMETSYELEALKSAATATSAPVTQAPAGKSKEPEKEKPKVEEKKEEKVEEPEEGLGGFFDF